jgi:hypothetical protein
MLYTVEVPAAAPERRRFFSSGKINGLTPSERTGDGRNRDANSNADSIASISCHELDERTWLAGQATLNHHLLAERRHSTDLPKRAPP